MSKIAQSVGENIRRFRKLKGLSQEQLALRADINASYMGQVERGEKSPTIDVLGRIASALQTPLEQLVGETKLASDYAGDGYADKIANQLNGLSVKEQEAVYRFVKQLVQFKTLE